MFTRDLKPRFLFIIGTLAVSVCWGQGVKLTPIAGRYVAPSAGTIHAAVITDTLSLPFFEDFTGTPGYPSLKRWCEQQVWVNNSFPVNPPNYNAATFDHLNQFGKPYSVLNKNNMVYADSLTSQPIKLDNYKNGPNTVNYQLTDTLILSFYLQLQGLGDAPEKEDSLILFFRDKNGNWNRVWSKIGGSGSSFNLYQIQLDNADYLYNAFQFRFVNYTKSTGNLNQWHLDYIRMEKYHLRAGGNDILKIQDVGIVWPQGSVFKNYFTLPYSHFKTDVASQKRAEHKLVVRNLSPVNTVQTRFAYEVKNQYGVTVFSVPFSSSSRNILPNDDSTEKFQAFTLDTFTGINPSFGVTYRIDPQSSDGTPDAYNTDHDNNSVTVLHRYTPWYAYDDGSAEGGIGLDYAALPDNAKTQFAMKFTNLKDDSLRGIAIYFNRSLDDVSFRSFTLRIWKALTPLGKPDNQDQLMYEFEMSRPIYTDSMNKFVYIFFDSVLPLPKGDFYIGWKQVQRYVLNIGYDNNYRYNDEANTMNPNLFKNMQGQWEYVGYDVKGVPMMRPLLGVDKDYTFNTRTVQLPVLRTWPNPAADFIYWDARFAARQVGVYTPSGRLVAQDNMPGCSMDVSALPAGVYIMRMLLMNGQLVSSQIIKK